MAWTYRVCKTVAPSGATYFSIQEVYDGGGFCEATVTDWETLDDLRRTLDQMVEAFAQPVLERTWDAKVEAWKARDAALKKPTC